MLGCLTMKLRPSLLHVITLSNDLSLTRFHVRLSVENPQRRREAHQFPQSGESATVFANARFV